MLVRPQLSYPGVYVQESSTLGNTIAGVSTSVTGFIGRTLRGPVAAPLGVNSYGDFQRWFGGLSAAHPLGHAVDQFFDAGGATAVIIRLAPEATTAALPIRDPKSSAVALTLTAHDPGAWANALRARVDWDGIDAAPYAAEGLAATDLFNLYLTLETPGGPITETFQAVTLRPDTTRSLSRVLAEGSLLVRAPGEVAGTARPPDGAQGRAETQGTNARALVDADYLGTGAGIHAFDDVRDLNLLCVPPDTRSGDTSAVVCAAAAAYARKRRAFFIADGPVAWDDLAARGEIARITPEDVGITGDDARFAAVYFPRIEVSDVTHGGATRSFAPSGMIAGVFSRTDATRGVWKAPAGMDASLSGVQSLTQTLTNAENGVLNPLGINCLRTFSSLGPVVWGARTLAGGEARNDDFKYIPTRRLASYIESSIIRGTKWAVFEPNDEPLWSTLRTTIGGFMSWLSQQGAFQGASPGEAYQVRCDASTTTQSDIERGIVNVVITFAPVKPAEFVVLYLQLVAGQTA